MLVPDSLQLGSNFTLVAIATLGLLAMAAALVRLVYGIGQKSRTVRLQVEAAKTETKETYHQIIDHMLNGFQYCQLIYENGKAVDFIYLKVNPAFEQITGLANVTGKKLSQFIKPDEKQLERLAIYQRVANSGRPEQIEVFVPTLGQWFRMSIYTPQPDHFVGLFESISNDKLREKKIAREHQHYQALLQDAPIGLAMVDQQMNYLAYSQRWLLENGHGLIDLNGLPYKEHDQDSNQFVHDILQQALSGVDLSSSEKIWQQEGGNQRWIRLLANPWKNEQAQVGGLIIAREDITEQQIAELDLLAVLDESGDAIWISNDNGDFVYANPNAIKLTGHTQEELNHLRFTDLIYEERPGELLEYLSLTQYSRFTRREWLLHKKDRSTVCVEITTGQLPGGRMIALARDLTEKIAMETERFKLFQAVEQSPGCIIITNLDAEIEYVNGAFLKKNGYHRDEVIGKNPRILKSGKTPAYLFREMWAKLVQGETWQGELIDVTKNGQEYIQLTTITPIRQGNGNIINYIAIGEDITSRKKGEERIFELAYFDQLTGLPNRTLLLDRLNQVIAMSARSGVYGALLFIDLDHFKNINDTLGHQKGDLILKQVADNLMLNLREGDTVARFGGDEFIVLLSNLGTDSDIAASKTKTAALKLLTSLNQTYQLGEVAHHSSASIGVTLFNGKESSSDQLLKQADLAMYKSKKAGRNSVRFFDPSLESAMKQHATLEDDIRQALDQGQFVLHYQGQFNSRDKLTGAEVLVRWQHPVQGMMSPALFIPFAEETGLILPLGNWVLETACKLLASWEKIPRMNKLVLAVNVSALQFRQSDFIETVVNIIHKSGANPQRLKLELTESMLIENLDDIIHKMLSIKELGVGFSLDDFGTGFSSLSFLKRLPLDQLKIDQSFIKDVHSDPNGAAIAKTIVALGKSLGLNVIAEGVETVEQREFLSNAGCHAYQGYLFSRPLALTEFEELARSN